MRDDRLRSLDQDQSGAKDRRGAGAPAGRQDLGRRLESLPDGHPSSRNEADGTPRAPATRLRDLDPWPDAGDTRPCTDAEWSEHIKEVRTGLADAQSEGLATDRLHTIDPARKIWSGERDLVHDSIIEDFYKQAASVPCDRKAIMAGGLGGAGKSTVLSDHSGVDLSQYLTINPDKVKEEMARRGLIPAVEGLSPMEASDLVHEESSHIAKRLARRAEADGKNIIWDITMSSRESTEQRITASHDAGYTVDAIFVDIPVETSIRRADARHREGHDDYRAGVGLGGRYVPPEVIQRQYDPDWGSKNRKTFEDVRHLFREWSIYDNSVDFRPAQLKEASRTAAADVTDPEEQA